ncbi:MAG: hypothetical protein O3C68_02805 [Proteobacteria bacterium]|nr:hypothetical protein [Pseudomonadota bacterium]
MSKLPDLAVVLLVFFLVGCGTSRVSPEESSLPEPVDVALVVFQATDEQLTRLNLSIVVFDVESEKANSVYSSKVQVSSVEKRFLPFRLKETLDRAGFWGAVRVMPQVDLNAEINITGKILFSDGVELKLHVRAVDATGRVWLDQIYYDVTSVLDYSTDPSYQIDPFQDLYDKVSNDLSNSLNSLTKQERDFLINVATLKYARELSPETFGRYLSEDMGLATLNGLPSEDDPLFQRVQRIRESEYLFADSVDQHYESLYRQIGPTYAWWRYYSHELIEGNRRLTQIDATRGATRGSWYSMERIYKTYKESKMNEDALRELTNSFDRETEPTVTELAGSVVRLTGTLDRQYEEWRRLLRELYRAETGY